MALDIKQLQVVDEDKRIFESVLSAEMRDNAGDIVTPDEVKKYIDTFLQRGGTMTEQHSNRHVGRVMDYWEDTILVTDEVIKEAVKANPNNSNVKGILRRYKGEEIPIIGVRAQIFDDYPMDDKVWEKIKTGEYRGVSFGGQGDDAEYDEKHGGIRKALNAMYEVAVVDAPRVALALFTGINDIAQRDDQAAIKQAAKNTCLSCGQTITQGDNNMPFADYKDFDACVAANKDKDDPEAYCASIKREVEGDTEQADDPMTSDTEGASNTTYDDEDIYQGREKLFEALKSKGVDIDEDEFEEAYNEAYPDKDEAEEKENNSKEETDDASDGTSEDSEQEDTEEFKKESPEGKEQSDSQEDDHMADKEKKYKNKEEEDTEQQDAAPEASESPEASPIDELKTMIQDLSDRVAALEGDGEMEEDVEQQDPGAKEGDKDPADDVEKTTSSPDETKDVAQRDNVQGVTPNSRGAGDDINQSDGVNPLAVARGEQKPTYAQIRGTR